MLKKKKLNVTIFIIQVSKVIETIDSISFDLVEISKLLYNGKTKIDKELNELNILLSCESHT